MRSLRRFFARPSGPGRPASSTGRGARRTAPPSTPPHGGPAVAPSAEQVLALEEAQFEKIGAKFHRSSLQAAATSYQRHCVHWQQMDATDLVGALTTIPRLNPWTASAAATDFTGDFSASTRTTTWPCAPGLRRSRPIMTGRTRRTRRSGGKWISRRLRLCAMPPGRWRRPTVLPGRLPGSVRGG